MSPSRAVWASRKCSRGTKPLTTVMSHLGRRNTCSRRGEIEEAARETATMFLLTPVSSKIAHFSATLPKLLPTRANMYHVIVLPLNRFFCHQAGTLKLKRQSFDSWQSAYLQFRSIRNPASSAQTREARCQGMTLYDLKASYPVTEASGSNLKSRNRAPRTRAWWGRCECIPFFGDEGGSSFWRTAVRCKVPACLRPTSEPSIVPRGLTAASVRMQKAARRRPSRHYGVPQGRRPCSTKRVFARKNLLMEICGGNTNHLSLFLSSFVYVNSFVDVLSRPWRLTSW